MSLATLALILLAGIGAGFVGYAVGASSLVSYPALLALGIPPVVANASNTVGVIGTGVGGMLGARRELAGQGPRAAVYILIGALGGVAGALLLLGLDPTVFEYLAPALILLSAALIGVNPRGRMHAKRAADGIGDSGRTKAPGQVQPLAKDAWWVWLGVCSVAVYSGYFGAGAGTLGLAMLDAARIGPFHKINALKTLVGMGANISASVVFIAKGVVDWPAAIMLCAGCFIGGYVAPPITRRVPAKAMRAAAVVAGIILAADLAVKTY